MNDFAQAFAESIRLIVTGDPDLLSIVFLSLRVSLIALALSAAFAVPLGALLAVRRFPGRPIVVVIINALMGLPPVVVGLVVYLALSRSGPFGVLELLYTPTAMIVAQSILITPILAALTLQVVRELDEEYAELMKSLGVTGWMRLWALIRDARMGILTALLAGFGRASAEVGAVMIVGGNINHVTRVMTTAIALETSRGELGLALALGTILVLMSLAVNATLSLIGAATKVQHG